MKVLKDSENKIPVIQLENDHLCVRTAPGIGGRITHILHKDSGYDFLWKNMNYPLQSVKPGSEYDPNFYGGMDDVLPSMVPENVNGMNLPDHGEVWTQEFQAVEDDKALLLRGVLPESGLEVEKCLSLQSEEPVLDIDYRINNPGSQEKPFLWSLHPALNIDPGDQIICPAKTAEVGDPDYSRWDIAEPFSWPEIQTHRADIIPARDESVDCFYLSDLESGVAGLHKHKKGLKLEISFDRAVFPFVWLFASYGGFMNHYTAMIEPCTTKPLSVAEADKSGICARLGPGETLTTRVSIYAGYLHPRE